MRNRSGKFVKRVTPINLCGICVISLLFVSLIIIMKIISVYNVKPGKVGFSNYIVYFKPKKTQNEIVKTFFERRKNFSTSALGNILYNDEPLPPKRNKTFKILIWKSGPFLERRHIYFFQNHRHDPFENCAVKNCELTYDSEDLETSDAVVVLLHRLRNFDDLPDSKKRPSNQRWIFLTDENPHNTFMFSENKWREYSNVFNWSMSYRYGSDIPVPYGRTVALKKMEDSTIPTLDLVPYNRQKRRDVLVSIMISNCASDKSGRLWYLKKLQEHISVDVYGNCGGKLKMACPGHFASDCPKLNDYMFYLAFENSNCKEYMTEKIFWNAYSKGAVPIIMGPSEDDCETFLPPNSYIHVEDFAKPSDLAEYILLLNNTWFKTYVGLHEWRRNFEVLNEHGYFGTKSYHYCRICEGLNYNDESVKVYEDLSDFLDPESNCEI